MCSLFLSFPQLSHHFQNVILISAVLTRPDKPFVVRLRTYILLSRVTLPLRLHHAQHPVPNSVTHNSGVFSIWLPLVVTFLSLKRRGIYTGTFRRSRKSDTRSTMNSVESWWGVLSFSKTSHGEPSSPIGSLSPCFFPGPSSFPWPLPSNQTL